MTQQWVYPFTESSETMRELLGGKGAGLAGMTTAGFPVPPGFTISTEACRAYFAGDHIFPGGLWAQTHAAVSRVEETTAKQYGGVANPLLFSVRSGAAVSMPGMMDTILNLGLNDETVEGLAKLTGDEGFAWESYRRFVAMFGEIVFGVPRERMHAIVETAANQSAADGALSSDESRALIRRLKDVIFGHARTAVPDDPDEQLRLAIAAVFDSWTNRRANDYRRLNNIADDIYTAVNVQAMVFGNTGEDSGTGVAFTRNPTTGAPIMYGEFLSNAQGEDVVAGLRTPDPIASLEHAMPGVYNQLREIADRLENHYRDMQDMEFTVEHGKLWMLQTRSGKRTGRAAIRVAVDLVHEGLIAREEAVNRVTADRLEELLHPIVMAGPSDEVIATGLPASPGGASGGRRIRCG